MFVLATTTALVNVITGSAGAISVHASFIDTTISSGTVSAITGQNIASITGAGSTTVVPAPSLSGISRTVQKLIILNTSATVSNLITVQHVDGNPLGVGSVTATTYSAVLAPGAMALLTEQNGWQTIDATGALKTTAANPIAAYTQVRIVSTGTTDAGPTSMAAGNCLVLWNSATAGAKTSTIPTAAGTNNILTIIDYAQTAQTNAITATPATGAITGNNQVYTKAGAQNWIDTSLGWVAAA
jgi:hypothetical protein